MSKFSFLVIIALLVALAAWFLSRPGQEKNPLVPRGTQQSGNIVSYTNNGYSPTVLKVKVGGAVTFKNESSNPMWTASNPHPTHTALQGFDSLTGVTLGQSYSFTFNKAGTWRYHNHLNPSHTGTIIVE